MKKNKYKEIAKELLASGGIQINGKNPWDIQVHDDRLYKKVLTQGNLGLGEAYMDGWWDCRQMDELFFRIRKNYLREQLPTSQLWRLAPFFLEQLFFNTGNAIKAFIVGEHHYDIGNNLYEKMLDKRMVYTCGYWENASNLEDAQEAKLDLVCKKIGLEKGMTVLDIGCGWGSFAKFAAERYGARVVGITVSEEQAQLATERCAGLPIEIRMEDYRDTKGVFDRVVSLGMFEHVGYKNYRTYMKKVHSLLNNDGMFLLHTIGSNKSLILGDSWMVKYIFPGGMLPSVKQIGRSTENLFVMEDWHNFGADYDKTLMAWFENFDKNWGELKKSKWIDEKFNGDADRFYRMWEYYLLSMAGVFRARYTQLWQIVLSKKGVIGGYKRIT